MSPVNLTEECPRIDETIFKSTPDSIAIVAYKWQRKSKRFDFLRHTFATDLYRKIKDPVTVKNALGHSSITTTMIYVHLVGADVEKALSGGD